MIVLRHKNLLNPLLQKPSVYFIDLQDLLCFTDQDVLWNLL